MSGGGEVEAERDDNGQPRVRRREEGEQSEAGERERLLRPSLHMSGGGGSFSGGGRRQEGGGGGGRRGGGAGVASGAGGGGSGGYRCFRRA